MNSLELYKNGSFVSNDLVFFKGPKALIDIISILGRKEEGPNKGIRKENHPGKKCIYFFLE